MAEGTFKIALLQQASQADPAANLERTLARTREAAAAGARLVCTPELFRSRYFCQSEEAAAFDLAEPVPGPSTEALSRVARECEIVLVAGLFERRAAGLYHDTAAVIDADGKLVGTYRKMHIPDDPHFHEKFYFTPGDQGFVTFETRVGRIGVLLCWDQWYPEAARLTALGGADLLLYPSAIGWLSHEKAAEGEAQIEAWRTMHRAHAIANGIYVAAINRVGHEGPAEDGIEFWGGSLVADPLGRVVAAAAGAEEQILTALVEPERIEAVRRDWPFLRDRRIDAYAGLGRRFLDR